MKIGFCSLDWSNIKGKDGLPVPGGAGWYRCVLPAKTLAAHGVECVYGWLLRGNAQRPGRISLCEWADTPDGIGTQHDDIDVLVIQRWMGEHASKLIYIARSEGQIIVNDIDDWFEGLPPRNAAWNASHPKYNPTDNRDHYRKALSVSSALTVSTPYLQQRYQKMFPLMQVYLVPNMIDVARWRVRNVTKRPTVGWVGATFNRSGDLEVVQGTLNRWLEENGAGFFHGGADHEGTEGAGPLGINQEKVRYASLPMVSIEKYPNFFSKFNIGIVPNTLIPFNFAKSHIKGLEMSASGIPFVASPTPAYQELGRLSVGLLAERPRDWLRRLDMLRDPEERTRLGLLAREVIEHQFDIDKNWTHWRNTYQRMSA